MLQNRSSERSPFFSPRPADHTLKPAIGHSGNDTHAVLRLNVIKFSHACLGGALRKRMFTLLCAFSLGHVESHVFLAEESAPISHSNVVEQHFLSIPVIRQQKKSSRLDHPGGFEYFGTFGVGEPRASKFLNRSCQQADVWGPSGGSECPPSLPSPIRTRIWLANWRISTGLVASGKSHLSLWAYNCMLSHTSCPLGNRTTDASLQGQVR